LQALAAYLLVIIVKENTIVRYMKRSSFWVLFALLIFTSCRKNDTVGGGDVTSDEDKLKDSTLMYTKDVYLWNDQIPSDFNARGYAGPEEIMTAIRQYSNEPGFSEPVDHYSFAIKQTEWDNLSNGIISDFGLNAFFFSDNDLRVRLVEEDSPAGRAGIRRGWKFLKVAGSTEINTDNIDFLVGQIYESGTTAFTFEKPDGTSVDITLNSETYHEHPVVLDTVYSAGARTAGYLVFNSFLGDTSEVIGELSRVFNRFVSDGVTDVIVDLRYNGGGYVTMQEAFANFLVKSSANTSIMMSQVYNDNYSDLNETTRFHKRGALDVNNVYFIVTDNTASASELLINNLKPYMNVKLVGPEATYGKPVGFFPIAVGDWYIFPVSFRSTNGVGEGNYFDGISVDNVVADGLDKDWGDVSESSLASALKHISTGSFSVTPPAPGLNSVLEEGGKEGNVKMNRNFKGAIM
jgi:carboxyl-terminal processing protease